MLETEFPVMDVGTTMTVQPQSMAFDMDHGYCHDRNEIIIDQSAVNYFKLLIHKYKKSMGDSENTNVCSGGLQQYLIREHKNQDISVGQEQSQFESLPINVRLYVFSYLSAKELCSVSQVCRSWYGLTQDNLLWQQLLTNDVNHWHIISHSTNPDLYKQVHSEWSNKEIYLRCSPEVNQLMHKQNAVFNSITSMIRYFLPKKVPKFAMFGPGLETSTSKIVRKIMYTDTVFHTEGLFPGQFDGFGGGMTLKTATNHVFNLTVLYSASRREREQVADQNRMQRNKLVKESKNSESGEKYELVPAVRDLCQTLDGFVYVVDASRDFPFIETEEMIAMVSERWLATYIPLLVLSCVPAADTPRIPCSDIVTKLNLASLNRPWQVRNCVADSLSGAVDGFVWLSEQTQRR